MTASQELVLLLSFSSAELGPQHIRLTKKAIAGLERYAQLWHGPVRAILEPGAETSGNLDEVVVDRRTLPFEVSVLPMGSPIAIGSSPRCI